MTDSNPFGDYPAPTAYGNPPAPATNMGSNPFDPFAGGQPPPPASPFGAQQPTDSASLSVNTQETPFGANTSATSPYAQNPPQQQYPPQNGGQGYSPTAAAATATSSQVQHPPAGDFSNPFGAATATPSSSVAPASSFETSIVPSQQQQNPYALPPGNSNPFGAQQHQQQAIVPSSQQQGSPWAVGGPVSSWASVDAASFDPFAVPPPASGPAPPPPSSMPDPPQPSGQVYPGAAPPPPGPDYVPRGQEPPGGASVAPPPSPHRPRRTERKEDYNHQNGSSGYHANTATHNDNHSNNHSNYSYPPLDSGAGAAGAGSAYPYDHDANDTPADGSAPMDATRHRYGQALQRQAPPGAAPLPKADLVRKRGFVLSRISFRTIVMKKWKQSYWVQYGPHTMLWFRSQSDFDDWLNNPYHNQAQRNFLIKLAVNFVHDLYKPNVRGYQVTQCRTKPYGKKMVRQFKLERWMDYGPTIAAAFGSYNPREVDSLREALVECMRNTPLSGGLRATGAVRQGNPHVEGERRGPPAPVPMITDGGNRYQDGRSQSMDAYGNNGAPLPSAAESVAEETDLLDMDNWDDVPTMPGGNQLPPANGYPSPVNGGLQQQPYPSYPQPPQQQHHQGHPPQPPAPYPGQPQQQQTQSYYQQQQQPPVGSYQDALVPLGASQAYPGAPPMQQQQQPVAAYDPWGGAPAPDASQQQQQSFASAAPPPQQYAAAPAPFGY